MLRRGVLRIMAKPVHQRPARESGRGSRRGQWPARCFCAPSTRHNGREEGTHRPQVRSTGRPEEQPMHARFTAPLLMVGCIGTSYSSMAASPTSIVRAQRAEYNAAIAAHDPVRLRTFLVDDYHLILGSSGNVDSGANVATRGYADEDFKDPTFVTYRRTPTTVVTAVSGRRIAETWRFEGIWQKPDGTMRKTGIYLAMWVPSAGTWRLKSGAFVTLACTGSTACDQVD